ncbi:unnamed protein product [Brachionus calyciflorus]|uniref:Uncharacterized protein n=1 Tax=Brachionus calyciflorus TaxID=104777 RepID=A0A814PGK4_9BILA|nr:unnamed protein product [Brachionus calyciflorus]
MDCSHPYIYKSIEFFKEQETSSFVKYALENKAPPPRRKLDIGKDNNLDKNPNNSDSSDGEDDGCQDSSDEENETFINIIITTIYD